MRHPIKTPVSVLIPTKNEIANIRECIESVQFASEVVVVDSNSTDGTQEIAQSMGATVVPFTWNHQFPKKKNWALENYEWKNEWVLILDADERITPELAEEIHRCVMTDPGPAGFFLNRKFMFMGQWIKHSGYFPSFNLRLLKHRHGRYERLGDVGDTGSGDNEVHEHIVLSGPSETTTPGYLKEPMLHFAYPNISTWVEKHNRYSNWEALVQDAAGNQEEMKASLFGDGLQRRRWIKKIATRMPFRPMLRFLYHYVAKLGFLDGRPGFILCCLMAFYEFLSVVKRVEAQRTSRNSPSLEKGHAAVPEGARLREIPAFPLREEKAPEVIAG